MGGSFFWVIAAWGDGESRDSFFMPCFGWKKRGNGKKGEIFELALVEAKAILHDRELSFTDKFSILAIIKIIERKLDFHYKHNDFNLAIATAELKRARKLLKM